MRQTSFYFLKQHIYNDSLDENSLSETPWRFIVPLEELAGTLGALEVESAWVLLGARCGQYQGLVAVAQETFRCNVAVARVNLSVHSLQVFRQFV